MKTALKYSLRAVLLVILLSNYVAVCLSSCLNHNHEFDGHFHENCPACQWNIQTQEDVSSGSTALDAFYDPLIVIGHIPITQTILIKKQNFKANNLSRAPPPLA